jgi:WD40 repeat protein
LAVTASEDHTACVWRVSDGAKLLTLPHTNSVLCAAFSPDGLHILTSCVDAVARIWNARTGQREVELKGHTDAVIFAAYSPNGRRIVTTGRDSTVRLWDARDGHAIGEPFAHPIWAGYAELSADGRELLTACFDHNARVWDIATHQRILPELKHGDGVSSACYSPDGRMILTACLDHTVRLWLADTHDPLSPYPILRHSDRVTHAVFSPDGHRLATSSIDGTVRIWDLAGSRALPEKVQRSFCEDRSRFIVSGKQDVQAFDTASGQPVGSLVRTGFQIRSAKLNRDGHYIVTAREGGDSERSELRVWAIETGSPAGPSILVTNPLSSLSLSKDGKRLLVLRPDALETWSVFGGSLLAQIRGVGVTSAMFSPDGQAVAGWSANGLVRLWDASTGRERFQAVSQEVRVSWFDFSEDGSRFVVCGADSGFTKCSAQVRDAVTGIPLGPPLKHDDGVLFAMFDAAGIRVATGGEDFAAIVWDAATGRQLTPPMKHEEQVRTAIFSPDGANLVTSSADCTARVWSSRTGEPLTPPLRHPVSLVDARFLGNGRRIITTDRDGTSRIWDLPIDQRPAAELVQFARLLNGDMISTAGAFKSAKAQPLAQAWGRLRSKNPDDFTVSDQEVAAWHKLQADESEAQMEWSAAIFHLERLLALEKGRAAIDQRIARARSHLEGSNQSAP